MRRNCAIAALAGVAMLASGCTRTSYYVPPHGFIDAESAQCRGLSTKQNYDACIIAGRTGMSFPEVRRQLRGPEVAPPLEPQYPEGFEPSDEEDLPTLEPGTRHPHKPRTPPRTI